jgi:hypothetical protein
VSPSSVPVSERYFTSMFIVALGQLEVESQIGEQVFSIVSVLVNGCVSYCIHSCIALPLVIHPAVFSHSSPH